MLGCEGGAVASSRHILEDLDEVTIGRGAAGFRRDVRARRLELAIGDRFMSSANARLVSARERWVLRDAGAKNRIRVNGAAVKRAVLLDGDIIAMGSTLFQYRIMPAAHPRFADLSSAGMPRPLGLPTFSAEVAATLDALTKVAPTPLPVVLAGATGTGKEIIARALHAASGRRGELVAVNCGAIPAGLLESLLFGHRRGAFSGADEAQQGLIRTAHEGTLFLDELGDLPAPAQVALLRVLQDGEVLGVGETRPHRVDVRVVAAAQVPLTELVAAGRVRPDLAARLGGMAARLPTLAERRMDFGLLVDALLPGGARLTLAAAQALLRYSWPLNIRELERALALAAVLAQGEPIRPEHLPDDVRRTASSDSAGDERLRGELVALLHEHGGNVAEVARILGKARTQVRRWLKRFGLDPHSFRR